MIIKNSIGMRMHTIFSEMLLSGEGTLVCIVSSMLFVSLFAFDFLRVEMCPRWKKTKKNKNTMDSYWMWRGKWTAR
jgi:hypothetical protein